MQERLRGYYSKILEKWNSLSKTQKTRLVITVALLVLTLAAFIYITTRPKYYPLVTGRSYSEIVQLKAVLDTAGIASREANSGTALEVNQKDADWAAVTIGTSNAITRITDFTFQDALASTGMGTTESTKAEMNRRVYNTDLSRRLELIDGINMASVDIVLPSETNYYIESQQKASASVILELSRPLESGMGEKLARLIATSVKGLDLENIEISSTNFETIYSGSQKTLASSNADIELETIRKLEIEKDIRTALGPIANEVRVLSRIAVNRDRISEQETIYTSPMGPDTDTGLILTENVLKENVENMNPDAVPGLEANDQLPETYQTGAESQSSASVNQKAVEYLHDMRTTNKEYSIGDVDQDRSSVLVQTYKYRHYDEKYMTDNNLLDGMTWQEFKEAYNKEVLLPRDDAYNQLKAGLIIGTGIQDLELLQYEVPVFHDYTREPLQIQQLVMFGILALLILLLAFELIRKARPDEITEVEPELSVEDLLVSTQLEEEKVAEEERLKSLEFGESSPVKALIDKFVNERPEAVAQLLRNWLNEDWE